MRGLRQSKEGSKHNEGAGHQTRNVNFRINQLIVEQLQQEAEIKQVSLNTLVSQIFRDYVEWYTNAPKAGYLSTRRSLIVNMLNRFGDGEIIDFAKITAKDTEGINLLITSEHSLSSVLEVMEHEIRVSGYQFRKEIKDSILTFIIHHDLGRRWSLYLSELFKAELEGVGSSNTEFHISETTVTFRMPVN